MLLTSACSVGSEGFFEISGVSEHGPCFESMFPFEPEFLTSRERQGSAGLFMQSGGGDFQNTDLVYIEIFERDSVQTGERIEFSPPGQVDSKALGELQFGESCPGLIESLHFVGGLRLDEFDTTQGGVVSGRLEDVSVWSTRTESMVAESLEGSWTIEVRLGPPYEEFYVIQ